MLWLLLPCLPGVGVGVGVCGGFVDRGFLVCGLGYGFDVSVCLSSCSRQRLPDLDQQITDDVSIVLCCSYCILFLK